MRAHPCTGYSGLLSRSRHLAALAAATLALSCAAAAAPAFIGPPAARQLARAIAAAYGDVGAIVDTGTGAIFLCPDGKGGERLYLGLGAPRRCARAKRIITSSLAHGVVVREMITVRAPGRRALTFLETPEGAYARVGAHGCWANAARVPLGIPPFHFDAGERLTIAGRQRGLIVLRGTEAGPQGSQFIETDLIDPATHRVRAITTVIRTRAGRRIRFTDRYRELAQSPPAPFPAPRC